MQPQSGVLDPIMTVIRKGSGSCSRKTKMPIAPQDKKKKRNTEINRQILSLYGWETSPGVWKYFIKI
jgi:hypothetical protein